MRPPLAALAFLALCAWVLTLCLLAQSNAAALQPQGRTVRPATVAQQWALSAIHAPGAWTRTTGAGATVCDVDTGVDPSHPDLAPALLGGMNTVIGTTTTSWADDDGHGTAVASVMVGRGIFMRGVAPDARLLVAKAMGPYGGDPESVNAGIRWCVAAGAQVINLSLGGLGTGVEDGMAAAVSDACRHGVDVVAAAGNQGQSGQTSEPADIRSPCLVAVGAYDETGNLASWSNFSENPREVTAPGSSIIADAMGGGLLAEAGTSFAAPLVAGTLALERSTGVGAVDAVNILLASAEKGPYDADYRHGTNPRYGSGLLSAKAAVRWAQAAAQAQP